MPRRAAGKRAKSEKQMEFDPKVADMVVCPSCHESFRLEGERLVCRNCGRRYPFVDGIPVLIADRAEQDPPA